MEDLTKEDILKIVKESNKETIEEYFPSDPDRDWETHNVLLRLTM